MKVIDDRGLIKAWTEGVEVQEKTWEQAKKVAAMPFIHKHVALMPDAHPGMGATIGSVIPTIGAIIPAAVGVDLGCGMMAVRLGLTASDLPDDLLGWRTAIEGVVPHGRTDNGGLNDRGAWGPDLSERVEGTYINTDLGTRYQRIVEKHPKAKWGRDSRLPASHLGTLGTGNHFIEVCLDEDDRVWVVLHSGSRGPGNRIGTYFIRLAKEEMKRWFINLPDVDLSYFPEGTANFKDYLEAVQWAQDFALANREVMMGAVLEALTAAMAPHMLFSGDPPDVQVVQCHHNYCIAKGCLVEGPGYSVPIEDVQVGDIIWAWTPDGLIPADVRRKVHTGTKRVVRIITGGSTIEVTADHRILVMRAESHLHPTRSWHYKNVPVYQWVEAGNLCKGDVVVISVVFDVRGEPMDRCLARFLGAMTGDGWVRKKTSNAHDFGLAIGGRGDAHTCTYLRLAKTLFPDASWKNNAPGAFGLSASHKATRQDLVEYGCVGKGQERRLPEGWYGWSLEARLYLLSGYLDADGSATKSGFVVATAVRELAFELHSLSRGLGFRTSPVRKRDRVSNYGQNMLWTFALSAAEKDLRLVRSFPQTPKPSSKTRGLKRAKARVTPPSGGKFGYERVKVVEDAGIRETYDIGINNPNHAFVCNGVVVHNCTWEHHFGKNVMVTRKGAVRADEGDLGIIPGSMGTKSYIVEGKGERESFTSCAHGAGRAMSRTEARKRFTLADHEKATEGVECRKDEDVIDETPAAYKPIEAVMAAQTDLVDVVHTLKQVVCVKG